MNDAKHELRDPAGTLASLLADGHHMLLLAWETVRDLALLILLTVGAGIVVLPLRAVVVIAPIVAWVFFFQFRLADREGRRATWETFRLNPLGRNLLWVILAMIPMAVLSLSANASNHGDVSDIVKRNMPFVDQLARTLGGRIFLTLQLLLIAPFVEEIFFRGRIQKRFEVQFGAVPAVLLSAFLFCVLHLRLERLPVDMVVGTVLGISVILTGSVWAAILLHTAANLPGSELPAVTPQLDALTNALSESQLIGVAVLSGLVLIGLGVKVARNRSAGLTTTPLLARDA